MDGVQTLLIFLSVGLPAAAPTGSHSFAMLSTYIKGQTPFPEWTASWKLDDITVGYSDSEGKAYVPRSCKNGEEDDVVNPTEFNTITSYILADLERRWLYAKSELNNTDSIHVQQRLVMCELMDNDIPGPMITKNGVQGSTVDELHLHDSKYTYQSVLNLTEVKQKPHLDIALWRYNSIYYPACIKTLRTYLKKRSDQVKRKVKPRVRLIQNTRTASGWTAVSCLATGFYPRHLNLTLLRDGQPVADHLITGGELLPNEDGTYQMRKNLELSEEKYKQRHKYSCRAVHLSLDNKLDVHLDFDPGDPIVSIIPIILTILGVLVCGIILSVSITIYKKRCAASSKRQYSSANSKEIDESSQGST